MNMKSIRPNEAKILLIRLSLQDPNGSDSDVGPWREKMIW